MKTTIVSQGAEPVAAETFPALYESEYGAVFFYSDPKNGMCVVGDDVYAPGCVTQLEPDESNRTRITTPVTITFTP